MHVVFVELQIKSGRSAEFMEEVGRNATISLKDEPGCLQFDVVIVEHDEHRVLLYERYADVDAYRAHLRSGHFVQFDRATAPLVQSKRVVIGEPFSVPM